MVFRLLPYLLSAFFLLLVSLIVTAGLAAFGKYAAPHIQEWLLYIISLLVSISVISLLFAMMFKWLPDADVDWYDVWLGAIVTAVLFESENQQSDNLHRFQLTPSRLRPTAVTCGCPTHGASNSGRNVTIIRTRRPTT
jgi:Virulence factor BrkB